MEITDVKVKLVRNKDERLKAFCLITLDNEFVIRDIKIIKGKSGNFVAMPSRKTSEHCEKCGCKNHLRANYCNECGTSLAQNSSRHRSVPGVSLGCSRMTHLYHAACGARRARRGHVSC